MRYLSFVISNSDVPPTPELMDAMGKLIEREIKAGRLIDTGGLLPAATRVTLKQGELGVTDGPFAETKEVIGGYAMFEFANRDEAIASAIEFMTLHKQFLPSWEGTCEVREVASPGTSEGCNVQTGVSNAA
ncbi:hypothetical protein HNQ60_005171 [Povalibacter uvarum]|uniref:YCII-related domain-containing protein n=1 Tax=Povalibacter uvarum TaxID=732238 RepID=A0A841HVG2_9GAMM|nr:YciI family protein [Povalibacter uvarum]MBB6096249.1 hypothetical protein [Povalibacter uvarum]